MWGNVLRRLSTVMETANPRFKELVLVSEDIPQSESWLDFTLSRCLHNGRIVAPFGETASSSATRESSSEESSSYSYSDHLSSTASPRRGRGGERPIHGDRRRTNENYLSAPSSLLERSRMNVYSSFRRDTPNILNVLPDRHCGENDEG